MRISSSQLDLTKNIGYFSGQVFPFVAYNSIVDEFTFIAQLHPVFFYLAAAKITIFPWGNKCFLALIRKGI
jgi:hypothetical protein